MNCIPEHLGMVPPRGIGEVDGLAARIEFLLWVEEKQLVEIAGFTTSHTLQVVYSHQENACYPQCSCARHTLCCDVLWKCVVWREGM